MDRLTGIKSKLRQLASGLNKENKMIPWNTLCQFLKIAGYFKLLMHGIFLCILSDKKFKGRFWLVFLFISRNYFSDVLNNILLQMTYYICYYYFHAESTSVIHYCLRVCDIISLLQKSVIRSKHFLIPELLPISWDIWSYRANEIRLPFGLVVLHWSMNTEL